MLGIMKKDGFYFLLAGGVIMPLVLLAEGLLLPGYTLPMAVANLLGMFMLAAGPVAIVEQAEEKNNAYAWLSTLPLRRQEIIAAKFLLVFLTLTAVVAGNILQVYLRVPAAETATLLRNIFLLGGAGVLLLIGVMYNGILGAGYTRFLMAVGFVAVLLGLVPPILMSMKSFDVRNHIPMIRQFLLDLDAGLVIAAGVLLYVALLLLAIRLMRLTPREKNVPSLM